MAGRIESLGRNSNRGADFWAEMISSASKIKRIDPVPGSGTAGTLSGNRNANRRFRTYHAGARALFIINGKLTADHDAVLRSAGGKFHGIDKAKVLELESALAEARHRDDLYPVLTVTSESVDPIISVLTGDGDVLDIRQYGSSALPVPGSILDVLG